MNKTLLKSLLVLMAISGLLMAIGYHITVQYSQAQPGTETATGDAVDSLSRTVGRVVDNVAFGVGERLCFDIGYGFINAGTATMEVVDVINYNGRPAYQVVSSAQSNKFFSSFYPVDDRVESIIDAVGLFSWRFQKTLREGTYRANQEYTIDQVKHSVVYNDDTITVAAYVQDALSALYFVRTQPLEVGQSVFVDNFTDGGNYPLEVRVHRREKVKIKAGEFNCLVVEPLLQTTGVFKHEGKLTVWLTDDRVRLPVLMKSKVVVGSITAELTDYRLGHLEEF